MQKRERKRGMMRSNQMVLALVVVSICFFAAHSLASSELNSALSGEGFEGKSNGQPWPCCDNCGICTKSNPPICSCQDLRQWSCHPKCKKCVRAPQLIYPPLYRCMDHIVNFCERKCQPK